MKNHNINKKIKLLAVIHSLHGGGAEMQFIHVIKNLDRKKFDIVVCLFSKKGVYVEDIPEDIKNIYDLKRKNALSLLRIVWDLKSIIKKEKPQVIYSRHWKPNLITIIAKLLAKSKARIAVTEECVLSDALTYEYSRFKFFISFLVRWLYPYADSVISVSNMVKEDLIKNFGLPADKGIFVPNLFDYAHIDKIKILGNDISNYPNPKREGDFIITAMGRLNKQKGYNDLIKAIRIANEQIPCTLKILGNGPELACLQEIVEKYNLNEKVEFLGFKKNPFQIIKDSNLFAMASIFEGMPSVLLEVMSLGVPIIYTDVAGVRDVAEDGKEILIVPPKSPEILAEKIIFLYKNLEYRKKLSQNAQKKVLNYSAEVGIKKFEDLFFQLDQSNY